MMLYSRSNCILKTALRKIIVIAIYQGTVYFIVTTTNMPAKPKQKQAHLVYISNVLVVHVADHMGISKIVVRIMTQGSSNKMRLLSKGIWTSLFADQDFRGLIKKQCVSSSWCCKFPKELKCVLVIIDHLLGKTMEKSLR